jgi:hypothetical protein
MSNCLPWEDEWGFDDWLEWFPTRDHVLSYRWGEYRCAFSLCPDDTAGLSTCSRDDAARDHARLHCAHTNTPLPFRPRPDLSTVEGCLRAVADAGGAVHLYAVEMGERGVSAWRCEGERRGEFGTVGVPWALADVQAAARYVLGIPEPGDE